MQINKFSKKSLSVTLGLSVALTNAVPLAVLADNKAEEDVLAIKTQDKIVVGNEYIEREFFINNGKVSTVGIENSRANTTLIPQSGSEDFIINTIQPSIDIPTPEPILPTKVIDRTNWTASLTVANGTSYPAASVSSLFDGDKDTYINDYQINGYPTTLEIDLGEVKEVSSFSYLKRPGYSQPAYGKNGTMGAYKLYVSEDGETWSEAGQGEFKAEDFNLHEEGGLHNVGDVVYGNFDRTYEARYIRIDQLSDSLGGTQEFSGAEINLFSDEYIKPEKPVGPETAIKSSDLTVDVSTTKIEDIENGKKVVISYEPYEFNGTEYTIDMVTVLENDDHYMRSFLEITTNNKEAQIDYIDMDNFVLAEDIKDTIWSHPDLKDVSSQWIGKNELMLGQPIYANGMFFGSEFPAADTDVVEDEMQIRYYSGKTFEELERDNQLTVDGKFVSWQNVVGAAEGTDTDVVQTDFFEYISEIATPTEFRKQYNSWYDNMLAITDESIEKSFYGSEKGLTGNGIEPVDSYVVDDGWHNYRDEEFNPNISVADAGNSMNRTGFWEFNDKFPNELYTSTELTSKFQSKFGLWLGPQGGYNYFGGFGKYLEKMGTGYLQEDYWNNVCVGSDKYIKNLTSLFLDYQKRFDIDYWKLDGFAVRPCTSEDHDHMTGGHNNMYYTTDLWEKWTDAWETMRASRAEEGKDLFINATCYVNLSPWLLQWVNTVWVQDSGDTGHAGDGSRYQQKITYRDNVYYNLYKSNQVQFPLKNIYNHDPIYGVSDGSNATTEDFRDFLFANTVRGTAFWELYYSPSIMDEEKWQVNADALDFAESNFHILEKAKLFGNRATEGVYGYSAWNGNEGVVSFRNPTGEVQEYTLELTDVVGVPKTVSNLKGNQVLPYVVGEVGEVSYGDSITVTLEPFETRILQYGKVDTEAAEIVSAKVTGEDEITIKYNERVENDEGVYSVEGNIITGTELKADYRTVVITTENKLYGDVTLNINGERDALGNSLSTDLTIPVYKGEIIAAVENGNELIGGSDINKKYNGNTDTYFLEMNKAYEIDTNNNFVGTTDFAVTMAIDTTATNVNLLSQGEDIQLSIDEEGYVNFKVKDLTVNSKTEVTTVIEKAHGTFGTDAYVPTTAQSTYVGRVNDGEVHHITAVREVNGMLKVYIDGELANSVYDKSLMNQPVSGGTITVADDNFNGIMADIKLRNTSVYYDEAKELANAYEGSNLIEYSRENWTASACSEMNASSGDGNANCAIDGNENSWWHTNYVGGDNHEGNHWLAVDFGEEVEFDAVNLLSRGKGSNGTIKGYKLEANVNGEWTVVKKGEFTDGVNDKIELDEAITASELKITILSTFNGQNFGAIKELTVTKNDRQATVDEINEVKALVEDINEAGYTKATADRYNVVAEKVNSLDLVNTIPLKALRASLEEAHNGLLEAEELNILIAQGGELVEADYTAESWAIFAEALKNAKNVNNDIASTREIVDNAEASLKSAIDSLENVGGGEIIVNPVRNFIASEVNKKNVVVTWEAPKTTEGLEGYVLYKDGKKVGEVDSSETTFNFKGLNRHTIYNFKVAVKYSNGELSSKESITLRTAR
ncbi:discoidin domain-containing protein [Clostridium sp. B9]|uniref:discoidin domain-containing protein n=1 Tax=Clostridium sp. B9 TaxID=3423224 RepID=UPI003D2ED62B